MKKLFVLTMTVLVAMSLSVFTSCDKDDDDFNHPIVGTWVDKDYPDYVVIFKGDMTGSSTFVEGDLVMVVHFNYSVKDNQLTMKFTKLIENGGAVSIPAELQDDYVQTFEINNGELTFSDMDGIYVKK
ncbi:hypothetical protein [Carboxylicivirga taeanensis]|uniref:hypothetical protein n=1 Tax=Carboxylicivirga taeanensis TaxID=1416875 RepID=UPI003F6E2DC0